MSTTLIPGLVPVSHRELLISLGMVQIVEPVLNVAYAEAANRKFQEQSDDSPHGQAWHLSFHASQFPGDKAKACPRAAVYQMMDFPNSDGLHDRWMDSIMEVGKALELVNVRIARAGGRLVRSNQPGRSSDPEAVLPDGRPMPQMGFKDAEHWLTGSIDLPLLTYAHPDRPHIVEHKTKHEAKLDEMKAGERSYDAKQRRQLLCSLGLAHEHPEDFLHPTEDRTLLPATSGSLFYVARDTEWKAFDREVKTHEFYFEHSPEFMEQGRAHLKIFRDAFIQGELPMKVKKTKKNSHPNGPGWMWSQGECAGCGLKKLCRSDYDQDINKLADSMAIPAGHWARPGYDYDAARANVFSFWEMEDPIAKHIEDHAPSTSS